VIPVHDGARGIPKNRGFHDLSSTEGDVPEIARMARLFSGLSSTEGDVPEIARMARLFSGLPRVNAQDRWFLGP
jgi:hypothetical protein